jgi:hypothetical protein
MNTKTIDKIIDELKNIPEEKAMSLLDYLRFLQWESEDELSTDEIKIIQEAQNEIKAGKGVNWRSIKRDV